MLICCCKQRAEPVYLHTNYSGGLSLFRVMALTLGIDTLAWRPLIFTLSGLTDRSVGPWEMLIVVGFVPSVLASLGSCFPVWLCVGVQSQCIVIKTTING